MEEAKKKPLWKKWWFWGIIVVLLIALGSAGGDGNKDQGAGTKDNTSTPAVSDKAKVPDLEITEHSVLQEEYSAYIVGKVKNNTNKQYGYVQVEVNLYDADGDQVGSAMDNTNNLEPGGSWKFKAITLEEFDSYKIKDVSGW